MSEPEVLRQRDWTEDELRAAGFAYLQPRSDWLVLARELPAAEAHYRLALAVRPDDAIAAYNLGVVLQDRGELREAREAYERVLALDPRHADAHFNLAGVCERLNDTAGAMRHLAAYDRLTAGPH